MPAISLINRTFAILETVAASGSVPAKEIAHQLEIPLPSVYRLLNELVANEYLVHIKKEGQFELGPKCFDLGLSFRQRLLAPPPIRQATTELHRTLQAAAYFAIYRGADIVLTYLSDCEQHPRLRPLRFGFHEAAHATAFGKILLSGMTSEQRSSYIQARGMPILTPHTIARPELLDDHLNEVSTRGIAWEHEEFLPRTTCAAVPVRNSSGMCVGALAVSMPSRKVSGFETRIESALREYAGQCSRYMRAG
ncbi:IclR family transcriptional regulator [Nesterenkonia natronophila]|uniref:IclR family transcriptional regulator n=1 Tax=Nesterenkonia natronophila TaxID=2174932 RepID=A0A3A4F3T2_9MICC|nr:IclR family transcriptional regulator [Nesterenkonia natronophila]RJN32518.1 IclR family transcriptional regulator [Nesterenkonia natronophila]